MQRERPTTGPEMSGTAGRSVISVTMASQPEAYIHKRYKTPYIVTMVIQTDALKTIEVPTATVTAIMQAPTPRKQVQEGKGRLSASKPEADKKAQFAVKVDQEQAGARKPPSVKKPKPPHPLETLLGDLVVNAKGNVISPKVLAVENGVIGLYFAAHWCPPCRRFCPNLLLLYNELRKKHDLFEVIYISLDNKENSFQEYLSKMPWYAVPYSEEEKREEIAISFGVVGIPVLILLDAQSLEIINHNGRDVVARDPRGAFYPWKSMPEENTTISLKSSNTLSASSATKKGKERRRSLSMSSERSYKKTSTAVDQTEHQSLKPHTGGNSATPTGSDLAEH
ncbi:nucleoredoxin-like [Elysia marginata]|uniref:Nucleoredoxin-like n=1 Tax=Elysia marginata TaxID=1093978 RepID=A0AAV4ECR5_9GAST|nr:nucleoredoxin-like [Elysia marginata]